MSYIETEIKKINLKSDVISIKITDYVGNETKYLKLNDQETILALETFIAEIKANLKIKAEKD